jgi:hypothetical protein
VNVREFFHFAAATSGGSLRRFLMDVVYEKQPVPE